MSPGDVGGNGSRRVLPSIKIIVFIVFLMAVAALAVKNMQVVTLGYYDYKFQFKEAQTPLLFVILGSLSLGFFIAWISGFIAQLKMKSRLRKQTKTIQALNEEMGKIRSARQETIGSDR